MSLRMNLYGWSLPDFRQVLGSKNTALLERASERLSATLPKEPAQSKAKAWLRTLIESGFPLRQDRERLSEPEDGGLLSVQMETEVHVFAFYCLTRTIAREDHLNLSNESSHWAYPAVGALYRELAACGFTRSKSCCVQYFTWMSRLSNGSPLFGDDFRTEWSYYTLFSNTELGAMIPVLQAAADFRRLSPEKSPVELSKNTPTGLSAHGKEFVMDLTKWFGQIHQAGQDALILWW